jgi:hypothetical protein
MSLYLPEQKLGSHSQPDSTSHKFMLKGRQTGPMHRGHSWVFRAESHETMMAWYEDIESLISKTGEARNAYVRQHVRTVSGASVRTSIDLDEDEADRTPYAAEAVVLNQERPTSAPREPGGRFPSDIQIDRHVQAPMSPSSGESSGGHDLFPAAGSSPDGASFADGSRSVSRQDGSQTRHVDGNYGLSAEQNEKYYAGWMGPAEIVARQKQQEQINALGDQRDNLGSDRPSDGHPMLFAGMGSTSSRDTSLTRQRNRRESGSTAPTTTNITDHTHNTVPTSIEEDHGVGHQLRESLKNERAPSNMSSAAATPLSDITAEGPYGSYMTKPEGDVRRSKPSASALELQIPGHYPPANHVPA